jgi:large subunit ribosomal protein L21
MYAVVVAGGRQFKVSEGDTIVVDRMQAEVGSDVALDRVLLVGGEKAIVGTPTVAGATVTAEVLSHELGEKRTTFKYTRTRRTRVLNGSRPSLTTLRIKSIAV